VSYPDEYTYEAKAIKQRLSQLPVVEPTILARNANASMV